MNPVSEQPLVLVADDDEEFREEIIPEAMGRLDARILTAKDVRQACLVAAQHDAESKDPLHLIVLDMHMPLHEASIDPSEDAGIQFLRSYDLTECPVVVFTAYPSYQNCVRAVEAGAAAYLPKATQTVWGGPEGGIDQLVETCRRLLAKREPEGTRVAPDGDWISENYDWLCREFGGRWVAFVPTSKAMSAGIEGTERAGLVIIGEESRQSLARLVVKRLPFLDAIPHILFVPRLDDERPTS